jgi:hypothetical protein
MTNLTIRRLTGSMALLALAACASTPLASSADVLSKWTDGHRAIVLVLNPASCALSQDATKLLNSLVAELGADGHLLAFGLVDQAEAARAVADIGLRFKVHHITIRELERLGADGSTPLLAIVERGQVEFLNRRVDFDRLPSWLPAAMRPLHVALDTRIE